MATPSSDTMAGNLSDADSSFIGRRDELATVEKLLTQHRLITLTGPGGVGKTRLALRAADGLRAVFPDGIWLTELSPLADPELLGHHLVETLGAEDTGRRTGLDVLITHLTGRRLLLVLDTCEHLVEACARTAVALLEAVPGLTVLATSRAVLGPPAERVFTVGPLDCDETPGLSEAAELFLARAPSGDHNHAEVEALCRHLDGIPLAIELAAARLGGLTLPGLVAGLERRFDLLTEEQRDHDDPLADSWTRINGPRVGTPAAGRHRTLRTTIGWSHELCAPLERLLWARLSVFAGGCTLGAAEAVAAGGPLAAAEIPVLLDGLREKSIVRPEVQHGRIRYRMLDTVREFGAGWLRELGEEQETALRHCAFVLETVRAADAEWIGPRQTAWYELLADEHADLRAALDFSLALPDRRPALDLAGTLWTFWWACGHAREGRRYLELALAGPPEPGPERARALWALGMIAAVQGEAGAAALAALEVSEAAGEADPDGAASCLTALATMARGDAAGALAVLAGRPDAYLPGSVPPHIRMLSLFVGAYAHLVTDDFNGVDSLAGQLRTECDWYGDRWMRAYADYTSAAADLARGRVRSGAEQARAALAGKHLLHDSLGVAAVLDILARAAAATGDGERAARLLGLAGQIWSATGEPQLGEPWQVAARAGCEDLARGLIGDQAYESAFRRGLEADRAEGIAYALEGR